MSSRIAPRPSDEGASPQEPGTDAGLCECCRHAHVQRSTRGGRFFRCGRAERDPAWQRYPRLPVLRCEGHEPGDPGGD